jgi:hypothetical protein
MVLLMPLVVFSQERRPIKGRVHAGSTGVKDVLAVNINAEKETRTDSLGNFVLMSKPGDLLVFTGSTIETKKLRHTPDLFSNNVLSVEVKTTAAELEEVVINSYTHINSESLGLVRKGQREYTPAERKLETAGDFKPVHLLGLLAGSLQVDPILNAINGKTKRLKKEIAIETREKRIATVTEAYTNADLTGRFRIPQEHVKGFIYYSVEDGEFAAALQNKNTVLADLLLSALAVKYLNLLANDKE